MVVQEVAKVLLRLAADDQVGDAHDLAQFGPVAVTLDLAWRSSTKRDTIELVTVTQNGHGCLLRP